MESPYTLLLVDDEEENLDLLRRVFRGTYKVLCAQNGDDAMALLRENRIDLLLTDFRMPGMNGVQLMEAARESNPLAVRIVLTGYSDPQDIIDAINRGEAYRYLTKPFNPAELKLTVQQALEAYQLQCERTAMLEELGRQNEALRKTSAELKSLNEQLEERVRERTRALADSNSRLEEALAQVTRLARTDALTSLWNRRYFYEMAHREIERASRYEFPVAVLMIDLDDFKAFNDRFGHQAGDALLVRVGRSLQDSVRSIDLCARYGGEEFIILLPQTDGAGAVLVARRIVEAARRLPVGDLAEGAQQITLSIGVALYPQHAAGLDALIGAADEALYRAKAGGRNRHEVSGG